MLYTVLENSGIKLKFKPGKGIQESFSGTFHDHQSKYAKRIRECYRSQKLDFLFLNHTLSAFTHWRKLTSIFEEQYDGK